MWKCSNENGLTGREASDWKTSGYFCGSADVPGLALAMRHNRTYTYSKNGLNLLRISILCRLSADLVNNVRTYEFMDLFVGPEHGSLESLWQGLCIPETTIEHSIRRRG